MNATKKTLTTLTAAAALALGGIAVAQTSGDAAPAGASTGSATTLDNNSTAGSAATTAPSSDMSATPSTTDTSVAQADRN